MPEHHLEGRLNTKGGSLNAHSKNRVHSSDAELPRHTLKPLNQFNKIHTLKIQNWRICLLSRGICPRNFTANRKPFRLKIWYLSNSMHFIPKCRSQKYSYKYKTITNLSYNFTPSVSFACFLYLFIHIIMIQR